MITFLIGTTALFIGLLAEIFLHVDGAIDAALARSSSGLTLPGGEGSRSRDTLALH